MNILAIETSADETSAAVWSNGKLKSNIIYSQMAAHKKTGGIVPEVAARAHIPKIIPVIKLALKKAQTTLSQIDCLAVTTGPGLITSLMIGVDTAKTLAFALNKPIIPINHLEGHLLSALPIRYPLNAKRYLPALGLIVSGGHTMLVLVKAIGRYKILGETVDDAAGEAFDKIAKILGLPYPGGPALAKLAQRGNPKSYNLPRPMLSQKNYNFSFAGLKTAVLYLHSSLRSLQNDEIRADIAASAQQAIVHVLVEKTIRAAKEYKVKTILLGGGVAANKKLRNRLQNRVKQELPKTYYLIPKTSLTGDNAGMIAQAAYCHHLYGDITTFAKIMANPNLELESWR